MQERAALRGSGLSFKLLLVDDDPELLASMVARARRFRFTWETTLARGGQEALALLAKHTFDLVTTDLSMPRVGGGEVLEATRRLCPAALRFVLSGRVDRRLAKDAALAHQIFTKPADLAEILARAELALALRGTLPSESVVRITSGDGVPPSPRVFSALHEALQLDDYEPRRVAGIVEQDIAVTSRVLQLASSSALGPRRKVTSVRSAIVALGRDAIEQLVLLEEVLGAPSAGAPEGLRDHALAVGSIAARLEPGREGTFLAAVLHDVGHLLCDEGDEQPVLHPVLGAYLAALWGFSEEVVNAIAGHHGPARCAPGARPSLGATVHVADRVAAGFSFERDALVELVGEATAARWSAALAELDPAGSGFGRRHSPPHGSLRTRAPEPAAPTREDPCSRPAERPA
jgi:HD-like signal output (HDOD) protein/ActR/RegA family two-component response regulator